MFKRLLILLCLAGPLASCDTLTNLPVGTSPVSITEGEAAQGIKQALEQGIAQMAKMATSDQTKQAIREALGEVVNEFQLDLPRALAASAGS